MPRLLSRLLRRRRPGRSVSWRDVELFDWENDPDLSTGPRPLRGSLRYRNGVRVLLASEAETRARLRRNHPPAAPTT